MEARTDGLRKKERKKPELRPVSLGLAENGRVRVYARVKVKYNTSMLTVARRALPVVGRALALACALDSEVHALGSSGIVGCSSACCEKKLIMIMMAAGHKRDLHRHRLCVAASA